MEYNETNKNEIRDTEFKEQKKPRKKKDKSTKSKKQSDYNAKNKSKSKSYDNSKKDSKPIKAREFVDESQSEEFIKKQEMWLENIRNLVSDEKYRALSIKKIASLLQVPAKNMKHFNGAMKELFKSDEYFLTENEKVTSVHKEGVGIAEFSVTSSRQFGFALTPEGEEDIFIHLDKAKGAMNKDKIIYKIISKGNGKTRGAVVKILERGFSQVVGTYEKNRNFGFVIADNKNFEKHIYISRENGRNVRDGDKVVVEIKSYGDGKTKPEGKVIKIIGHKDDPKVDILSIINEYPIEVDFSDEVYESLKKVPDEVREEDATSHDREDFRKLPIITIDGSDAKDLDDAVYLQKLENGNFELGVHIADVSHYVTEKSVLDTSAYKRGTSIYLVDRVIPMLPTKVSNGICSLHPDVDRLTLSCIMEIDKKGSVVTHRICKSVIHSHFRMTYDDVREIIEDKTPELVEKYEPIVGMLHEMNELRVILGEKRKKRGTIDFDLPEAKVILDENGKTVDIRSYGRNIATNLIEEFMLLCNETVAEMAFWQEIPFIYRNHADPSEEKMEKLDTFLKGLGYYFKRKDGKIFPNELQRILAEVEGKDEEVVVTKMILRSMMQASYQGENSGHFGLATNYYTHFTSPIRRYSDLIVHRFMKMILDGKWNQDKSKFYTQKVEKWARQCSTTERVAEEMERETIAIKKVEFMMDKIGEVYSGVISGVTSWGIYVELDNTVEGMVAINKMEDDFYEFDRDRMRVVGHHSGKVYTIGDRLDVQVIRAVKEVKEIDFKIINQK